MTEGEKFVAALIILLLADVAIQLEIIKSILRIQVPKKLEGKLRNDTDWKILDNVFAVFKSFLGKNK